MKFSSATDAYIFLIERVMQEGFVTAPRDIATKELLCEKIILSNPRNRIIGIPERKCSLPLAIGEFAWHLAGSKDGDFIKFYSKKWEEYCSSNNTVTGSSYGHTIKRSCPTNILENIIELLGNDSNSRRAIIYFGNNKDQFDLNNIDVSCADSVHFLIRDEKLICITTMRSNDLYFGFPYDVFFFTMLQEFVAGKLNIQLGDYIHVANSLHIYEFQHEKASALIKEHTVNYYEMPEMDVNGLDDFLGAERLLRTEKNFPETSLSKYWQNLLEILGTRIKREVSDTNPYHIFL